MAHRPTVRRVRASALVDACSASAYTATAAQERGYYGSGAPSSASSRCIDRRRHRARFGVFSSTKFLRRHARTAAASTAAPSTPPASTAPAISGSSYTGGGSMYGSSSSKSAYSGSAQNTSPTAPSGSTPPTSAYGSGHQVALPTARERLCARAPAAQHSIPADSGFDRRQLVVAGQRGFDGFWNPGLAGFLHEFLRD